MAQFGVHHETVTEGNGWRWWDSVVVVWPSGWKREARGGGLGQKGETERLYLSVRCPGGNGGGGGGGGVVGWGGGGGGVAVRLETRGSGGGGLGQKGETELS